MRCCLCAIGVLCLVSAAPIASAADHEVLLGGGGDSFRPRDLTINVGDTVTFRNLGGQHNVHALDNSFRCANGCDAAGGEPNGSHWQDTIAFDQAGTIAYQCDPHASMGMRGTITVQEGNAGGGNVPITAGFTGAWFDPLQSGHGLFIEVLADNRILAWWFTFNPDGTQQAWFGNVGTIDGDTATVDAVQTVGGRWIPNFDPTEITQPPWGRLTFTFTDCDHGRVDFTSSVGGYGEGHMDLTRLTQPAGLSCP